MGKGVVVIGLAAIIALALVASEGGASPTPPGPGPGPTPPGPGPGPAPNPVPTSWRRMLDSELVPSEVVFAVQMDNTPSMGAEVIHSTAAGWRRWYREGKNVTVWRPSTDPRPASGGGATKNQGPSGSNTPFTSG